MLISNKALDNWITSKNFLNITRGKPVDIPEKETIVDFTLGVFSVSIIINYVKQSSFNSLLVERQVQIEIESEDQEPLDDYLKISKALKGLILFLTNQNSEHENITFFNLHSTHFDYIWLKNNLDERLFPRNFDIRFNKIEKEIKTVFYEWFKDDKLTVIIDLSLEKLYNLGLSNRARFLNACVGLESFHRFYKKQVIDAERVEKRNKIKGLIKDPELFAWFRKESSFWKQPNLITRLNDFSPQIEVILKEVIDYSIEDFLIKVKRTRNEIAHNGEHLKHLNDFDLLVYGRTLEFVLRIEILKKIGLSEHENSLLAQANSRIKSLLGVNNYKKLMSCK